MFPCTLIATTAFGVESLVVYELRQLGYEGRVVRPGRVAFEADEQGLCRANLWLRMAERVVVHVGSFPADDFGLLFDGTKALRWEDWIPPDGAFPVRGRSHKSQLTSVPACQRMVNKAVAERLLEAHGVSELPETGAVHGIEVELFENTASLLLDTSGAGLHKRGYRTSVAPGQLRETLAAAMVALSVWNRDRPFIDPFCGTGTIAIEAALIGRNKAPGLDREFAADDWDAISPEAWQSARDEARAAIFPPLEQRIVATDTNAKSLELARNHARLAGVEEDIHFQQRSFEELSSARSYGCVICNPPYGLKVGTEAETVALYRTLPRVLRGLPTWSHYVLTARSDFEQLIGQQATRRRKLYNGTIECTYYQFLGPKPPHMVKRPRPAQPEEAAEPSHAADAPTPREERRPKPAPKPVFGGLREEAERQSREFAARLGNRARHLRRWPTRRGITCYRLYDRDVPDVPLVVDRLEDALHIAEYRRPHERTPAEHADWLDLMVATAARTLEVAPDRVFLKRRETQSGTAQYGKFAERGALLEAHEGGLRFQLNLSDYLDTGLFLDHRLTRQMVREEAVGKRFLNLFGYTGAFTVYAAAGGAVSTTTVDLSPTYIEWARVNLRLNGLESPAHRFVASEARAYLNTLPRRPQFDLAVVDPPTFSNSKRADDDWDVQHDYADLLEQLALRMSPDGIVYFSTNFRRFKFDESRLPSYTSREITRQTVPEDFRNARIHRAWRLVKKGAS